jgi:hypothetical protein
MCSNDKRTRLVLLAIATGAAATGCGSPVSYHVKTNVPWPDQWIAGPRAPYSRELSVAAETVRWHRRTDVNRLAVDVEQKLAAKSSIFGFARVDYARRRPDPSRPDRDALPFVEVRVVPVWLLANGKSQSAALDASAGLRDAIEALARPMGRTVTWPDSERLSDRCGPVAEGDARAVLLRVLLERDLFVRCDSGPPDVVRSLEFRSEREFVNAIEAAARQSASRRDDGPIEIMHLREWIIDYVNRVCGGSEAAPFDVPGRPVGVISDRDVSAEVLADVKHHLSATLEYHVR